MSSSSSCLSAAESSFLLWSLGCLMLVSTLFHAWLNQSTPIGEVGKRPPGNGLSSWLVSHYWHGIGVTGYDPLLGALSPPLRFAIHMTCTLWFWALLQRCWQYLIVGVPDVCLDGTLTLSFYQAGFCAILSYMYTLHILNNAGGGVSHPGGPRPHRIQRQPAWPDKCHDLPSTTSIKFVHAQASHDVTHKRLPHVKLTGEAAGRDIWATNDEDKKSENVDEKLVQLLANGGRPVEKGFNPSINPNSCDRVFRAQMIRDYLASGKTAPKDEKPVNLRDALHKAVHFYSMLQTEDGHWSGDYGGPMFLLPGLVVVWYVMGKPAEMLNDQEVALCRHYLEVHQQTDGGWGTHIESPSTMFGTCLNYVALRLLGAPGDDPVSKRGRAFIQQQGGAIMTSSWAKFYLCLLGVMEWAGHCSVPPEMWLLFNWTPFHPGRMWCHARMVYLPMGYLYGAAFVYSKAETDPLIAELRKELYVQDYKSIPWDSTRHMIADMDNYSPIPWIMKTLQNLLAIYESLPLIQPLKNWVRGHGLRYCIEYMHAEDLQTNYINIGPVNKVLNLLSAYHHYGGDVRHEAVASHIARIADYLWLAEDGMKMKGYNGSQCWDTSFAIQAVSEAKLLDEFPDVSKGVWKYLERTQILSTAASRSTPAYPFEAAEKRALCYRHVSQGGWPFSTSAHGWPISDCTSEGLKGILCLLKSESVQSALADKQLNVIAAPRLQAAVDVLLLYQNEDGGWATYENNRGWGWYESLNPSEVFGDIMIDYSYVECSVATLTALVEFRHDYPDYRTSDIAQAIARGRDFVKSLQRRDGSWYGSWACCFCYGSLFGLEGLIACGEPPTSPVIVNGVKFLLKHQNKNGGWGEDFTSCYDKAYAQHGMQRYGDEQGSGVVNTSWALLGLACAANAFASVKKSPPQEWMDAIQKGVDYLLARQLPSGDWPQEGIAGVFNRACGITYTAYRNVFSIWALGRCQTVLSSSAEAATNGSANTSNGEASASSNGEAKKDQ